MQPPFNKSNYICLLQFLFVWIKLADEVAECGLELLFNGTYQIWNVYLTEVFLERYLNLIAIGIMCYQDRICSGTVKQLFYWIYYAFSLSAFACFTEHEPECCLRIFEALEIDSGVDDTVQTLDCLPGLLIKFLEGYNLSRLTQEELETMNRPITST